LPSLLPAVPTAKPKIKLSKHIATAHPELKQPELHYTQTPDKNTNKATTKTMGHLVP